MRPRPLENATGGRAADQAAARDGGSTSEFPHGVASGDVTDTSIELWTRLGSAARAVEAVSDGRARPEHVAWQVWAIESPDANTQVPAGAGTAPVERGIVRLTVEGLQPGRRYRYRFSFAGVNSPTGEFVTLPRVGQAFRLAVACCSRWPSGAFGAYAELADAKPDLVLHLGDYIYSDGDHGPMGHHDPPHACETDEDYERRYAQYRSDPDLQRLHASAAWLSVWDDHEFTNNAWARRGDRDWDERRHSAERAYGRWMPQRTHGNGPTPLDRALTVPNLFDLLIVDTRMGGRERQSGEGGPATVEGDDDRRLLTPAQWVWLEDRIADSAEPLLVIASSVQFSPLRLAPVPRRGRPFHRWLVNPDQWDGYPQERQRLLDLLRSRDDVVVLSGDLHARIDTGIGHIVEVTTPAVSSASFATAIRRWARVPVPTVLVEWWLRLLNPHIERIDLDQHGATLIDFTTTGYTLTEVAHEQTATRRRRGHSRFAALALGNR